ncbi:hypothetical protein F4802DRAFT_225386 [Xylaria palmicola]|nr:hypothetical protein F4802DRAFT_225386 [Xylaria palmicola]
MPLHPSRLDPATATKALTACGFVIGLALISIVLRFYTRILTRQGFWVDDWLILAAGAATSVSVGLLLWGDSVDAEGAWDVHNPDPSHLYTDLDLLYIKLAIAASTIYFTISGATKMGILFMYYRIFRVNSGFRYQLYVASGLVAAWWFSCSVAVLATCIPLESVWAHGILDPSSCVDFNFFWMVTGICETVLDVLILMLPISVLTGLQLSRQRKMTISGIFLLGGFVVISSIVKVILGYPPGSHEPAYPDNEVWTTAHLGVSLVCASLPIFNPLVDRVTRCSLVTKLFALSTTNASTAEPAQPYSVLEHGHSGARRGHRRDVEAMGEGVGTTTTVVSSRGGNVVKFPARPLDVPNAAEEIELVAPTRTKCYHLPRGRS